MTKGIELLVQNLNNNKHLLQNCIHSAGAQKQVPWSQNLKNREEKEQQVSKDHTNVGEEQLLRLGSALGSKFLLETNQSFFFFSFSESFNRICWELNPDTAVWALQTLIYGRQTEKLNSSRRITLFFF